MKKIAAFAALLLAATGASADLSTAERAGTFGQWEVLRDIDKMTDKVSCVGIYRSDKKIQLAEDGMYIAVSGGIESVTLRFGSDQARPMRLAKKMEKDVRAVMLEGEEFQGAIGADRLRMQVLTLVSGLKEYDLNMSGASQAVEHIKAGCPKQKAELAQAAQDAPANEPAAKDDSLCPPKVLTRLKAQGMAPNKIKAICAP